MLTLAMLNNKSCVTFARVELLKSFSEFKGLAYYSRVRRPTTCGQCRLDDEGSSDASEEPDTVRNEFGVFDHGIFSKEPVSSSPANNLNSTVRWLTSRGLDHEGSGDANEEPGLRRRPLVD